MRVVPREATNVGAEFKGVRSGVERRRGVSGIETEGWAERDDRWERKSSRNGVHRADGVARGPARGELA
jgi:hypothetical protein